MAGTSWNQNYRLSIIEGLPGRRTQVVKGEVCKTFIRRFESARRLHLYLQVVDDPGWREKASCNYDESRLGATTHRENTTGRLSEIFSAEFVF